VHVSTADRALPPDTKDWTWVLERPCGECGFDATTIGRADISAQIRRDAAARVLELSRPNVSVRARDDRWSILEYGCHVRDVYELYDTRLALMLDEDDPLFDNGIKTPPPQTATMAVTSRPTCQRRSSSERSRLPTASTVSGNLIGRDRGRDLTVLTSRSSPSACTSCTIPRITSGTYESWHGSDAIGARRDQEADASLTR